MLYYVDRIEGDSAVMDNDSGERIVVSLSLLPEGVRDGSVVRKMPDGMRCRANLPYSFTTV